MANGQWLIDLTGMANHQLPITNEQSPMTNDQRSLRNGQSAMSSRRGPRVSPWPGTGWSLASVG
jgi:hypothetical protein